jgi:lipopolysaccharide export system permease protein
MRLLDRYLLRELIVPLGYCLGGFLVFYVAFDLIFQISRFQEGHLLFMDVVKYYVVTLPELLASQVIPVSLLLAVLYALTNHGRYNELTAMRAAGVGLARLSIPYFGVAVILGIVVLAIDELWVPQSADSAQEILHSREGSPVERIWVSVDFHNPAEGRDWHIRKFNRLTSEMIAPVVLTLLPDGSHRDIYAESGIYTNGEWVFNDAMEWTTAAPEPGQPTPMAQGSANHPHLVVHFPETPALFKSELKVSELSLADATKGGQLSIREIRSYMKLHPNLSARRRANLGTQLYQRIAEPFTCLAVVLIALPFGARSGRRNVFVGVASSIFICFSYFIVQKISFGLGIGGYLPPFIAAWLPNLLFGFTGLALFWRMR